MDLTVTNPSVDLVELNNLIVSLRKKTKQAKLFVYRRLERKKKILEKKYNKSKNEIKLETINEEISKLKVWDTDRLTKAVLANEMTVAQAGPMKNVDALLVARIGEVPVIKAEVARFRKKYSDWKDLAAYLMYKNSSGKFKKNKTKKFGPNLYNTTETFSDMESLGDDSDLDAEDVDTECQEKKDNEDKSLTKSELEKSQLFETTEASKLRKNEKVENACLHKTGNEDSTNSIDILSKKRTIVHDRSPKSKKSSRGAPENSEQVSDEGIGFHNISIRSKTQNRLLEHSEHFKRQTKEKSESGTAAETSNEAQISIKKRKVEYDESNVDGTIKSQKATSVESMSDDFFAFENEPLMIENEHVDDEDNDFHNDFFCSVKNVKKFRKSFPQEKDEKEFNKSKHESREKRIGVSAPHAIKNNPKGNYHKSFPQSEREENKKMLKKRSEIVASKNQGNFPKKAVPDMHPSWAAKQREREKLLHVKGSASSKIVFDDSD